MTDFWVSQAKHFCQLCRCWTQGDAESIRRHESGAGHKEKEQRRLREKRQRKNDGTDADVLRQLAQIEAKAAASAKASVNSGAFAGAVDASFVATLARQRVANARHHLSDAGEPGRRLTANDRDGYYEGDASVDWYAQFSARSFSSTREEEQGEEEDEGGEYEVKGVRYFQGKRHAAKFVTNARCEVWDAALETWRPGTVARVKRVFAGEGSESESRTYDVQLDDEQRALVSENASRLERHFAAVLQREGRVLTDIHAKDLRVVGGEASVPPPLAKPLLRPQWLQDAELLKRDVPTTAPTTKEEAPPLPQREPVDENTGFGGWQTVTVREIDEVQEERERKEAEERREAQRRKRNEPSAEDKAARDLAKQMCDVEERRDARSTHLGVHDRTDVYKGIQLAPDDDNFSTTTSLPPAPAADTPASRSVAFKKRRTQNTSFRHQSSKKNKLPPPPDDAAATSSEQPPGAIAAR